MAGKTKVTSNWPDFLRDPLKTQELFPFLSDKIDITFLTSGTTLVSSGSDHCMSTVITKRQIIVVHLEDAPKSGCTTCLVRTVDADVVVILFAKYTSLVTKYPSSDIGLCQSAYQFHMPNSVIYDKTSHLESVKKPARSYVKRTVQHSSNTGSIATAHKVYCVPGWHLNNVLSGPATHTNP